MNTFRLLLTATALLFTATSFASQALVAPVGNANAQLAGQWRGTLPVPGGSRQVSITVNQLADGSTSAVLHMDAAKLNNSTMRLVSTPDSVVFYTDKVGCRFASQPVADEQRLRGQWQQPGFRAILVLDRVPESTTVVPAPTYKTEEVRVSSPSSPNPEIGLGGTLRLPFGTGPFPAVVLLGDARAQGVPNDLLPELADALTHQGLAVLYLDDRGTGRSAAVPSANAGTELVADAQSALQFLRTRPGIDPTRVGWVGHGEGANVALLAAAQAPAPAFLIALGAAGVSGQELLARQTSLVNQAGEADTAQLAWSRKDAQAMTIARREAKKQLAAGTSPQLVQVRLAQKQLRLATEAKKRSDMLFKRQNAMLEIIRQTPENGQAQVIVANMLKQLYPALPSATAQTRAGQLTSPWYRSFLSFDPQAQLGKVNCPVLVLSGTADAQVPTAINLPLLEKGLKANKHVNVQKLEGVDHNFQARGNEQALAAGTAPLATTSPDALDAVREWVAQQVK